MTQVGAHTEANGHRTKGRLKAKELKCDSTLKYGCEISTFSCNILPVDILQSD